MKKLFTLALALLVTFAGYSQVKSVSMKNDLRNVATMQKAGKMENVNANAQIEPNMVRFDIGQGELDYTAYDWQTNCGIINRTIVWPDGTVNFAYTCSSDNGYADRGTAIGTYDSNTDEWIPMGGRIENEKTGFGSIARYKDNGIVIASHNASTVGIFIVENKDELTSLQGTVPVTKYIPDSGIEPTWADVMTSGANRDIIHVVYTSYSQTGNPMYYARSIDGGQTWDKVDEVIPFLSSEYFSDWGSNIAYWMETTEDNRLALVVNNAWSDGMVIYSDDNGETWERKVYYHHPGINTTFTDIMFLYPRWTSAIWGIDGELCIAYEFNGSTGEPGSGSYYPGIGGVAFWSENMPYYGQSVDYAVDPTNPMPPTPGQPFIMDSAYIWNDIYASWWLWSDATHEMWPEYMGYLPALTDEGEVEPDPYAVEEFNIEDRSLHGPYNSGCVAMPYLCKLQDSDYDLVAVWSAMDENNMDQSTGNYYYKLFASYSGDGGRTWAPQVHITNDFMLQYTEHVYTQAAVIGNTLIVACQADGGTGTSVQGDDADWSDNLYQGYTFDLKDVFPEAGVGVPEVEHNNQISLYPNPAVDQLNVTLNKSAEMTIYNIMGQAVMTMEGRVGVNTIDLSNFTSGIYFISAGTDTQKFIVK